MEYKNINSKLIIAVKEEDKMKKDDFTIQKMIEDKLNENENEGNIF